LGDEGALLLSQAPWLASIERLELRHNYLTAAGTTTLLSCRSCQRMRHLDVSENRVSGEEKTTLMKLAGENNIALII